MGSTMDEVKRASPWAMLVIGMMLGGVIGFNLARVVESPSGGDVATPVASSARSEVEDAVGINRALSVTVGRGTRNSSSTIYPVLLQNNSGVALSYVKVDCVFYDRAREAVGATMTNWTNVDAGQTVSNQVVDHHNADSYLCSPSARR